jgi:cellulose synthase/poly-beta-1,6-N-acetylglucosamine synthase-like glycosyltransferase
MTVVAIVVSILGASLTAYGLFTLWLMLSAWDRPERLRSTAGPRQFRKPELSFTVLIPARDEELVIGETIARVAACNYPRELLDIIVICQRDDPRTMGAVQAQLDLIGHDRARLVIYDEAPFNKPHALNVGFASGSGEVVTVFDAEDDVHREIFNVMNTVMLGGRAGVVQGGVQLMNFKEHWFSAFNCVEYFFYFRSRLHFNASIGMVPLGGNTVSIRRELVERVGGWDESCLTEDADIGVRLSALGEPIRVVYDSRWVTREETAHSRRALVKQRTRWAQGFLQIFGKGDWRRLQGRRRRALAAATFGQPILDGLLISFVPLIPFVLIYLKLPVLAAMITLTPLYVVGLQMLAGTVGLIEFGRLYGERVPVSLLARMPFTYLACQWLIGYSAARAIVRLLRGRTDWEKTEHTGAHRLAPSLPAARPGIAAEPALLAAAQSSREQTA